MGLFFNNDDDWQLRCDRAMAKEFIESAADQLKQYSMADVDVNLWEKAELLAISRRLYELASKWTLRKQMLDNYRRERK